MTMCDECWPTGCKWGILSGLNVYLLGWETPALFSPAMVIMESCVEKVITAKCVVSLSHHMEKSYLESFPDPKQTVYC